MDGQRATGTLAAKPRLDALTGVRFIAALHVIAFHLYHHFCLSEGAPPGLHDLLKAGHLGVALFFVLSGFILGYNYLERIPHTAAQRRAFLGARFARVYPVYLLGLLVTAPFFLRWILNDLQAGQRPWMNLFGLVLSPVLLQSWVPLSALGWNAVGWSLSVEAFFYACFPFLGAWVARLEWRKALQVAAGAVAASCVLPLLYLATKPDGLDRVDAFTTGPWLVALRFLPIQRLPEFLLGICVARLLMSHPHGRPALPRGMTSALAAATLALLCVHDRLPFPLTPSMFAVLFAALLHGLTTSSGPLSRVLASRPLIVLGEASYALYILHMPVMDLLERVATRAGIVLPAPVFVPLFLLVAIGVSMAVFRYVEEPARRLLRRWFERPSVMPGAPATASPPRD